MHEHGDDNELAALAMSDDRFFGGLDHRRLDPANAQLKSSSRDAWTTFTSRQAARGQWQAVVDWRSGLVEVAEGAGVPFIPGYGNDLALADLGAHLKGRSTIDLSTLESLARSFLPEVASLLGTEGRVLRLDPGASGPYSDYLWTVEFDVFSADGLQIEGARIFFRINNGNLIQFGASRLPAPGVEGPPVTLGQDEALAAFEGYLGGFDRALDWLYERGELKLLSMPLGAPGEIELGRGYGLLPVWEFHFHREGIPAVWRVRVDASSGQIVEFTDTNEYAQVTGGFWPVSWRVDGVPQVQTSTGWPYTTVNPTGGTSNTSGIYTWDGSLQTANHTGPFVTINDNCAGAPGTQSSDGSGNIDFGIYDPGGGSGTPGDCTTAFGINDNTPSARQQYWHLNKIIEKGRTYLTSNTWLQAQLTANVNINDNCNAFWNGVSVNFFTSGGGCGNTGEDAGVSMHEWGHGMDANDGSNPTAENGTGETYGDFTAALQTLDSCVGQGFLGGNCSGYGNACVQCDGVRDIDWGQHTANTPFTVANFTQPTCPCADNPATPTPCDRNYRGPCGINFALGNANNKEGHCESYVSSSALFDFANYDLQSGCSGRNGTFPDFNCPGAGGPYSSAGAWGVADRLWYLSRPMADQAFTCNTGGVTWSANGCNAGSNWTTFRAVDDDDGNLANGTPHASELAAAFNRHGIGNTAGSSCAGQNTTSFRGCPQPAAPSLDSVTPGNNQAVLSWSPNPAPDVIDVFRNEIGCNAGFTRIANDVTGTAFVDGDVANGTTYYYQIVRHPVGNESCGSAPSTCLSSTPVLGPSAKYVTDSATLTSVPTDNDTDGFVDNCETGRMQVQITNDGSGALSNVRFTVTSPDGYVTVDTAMPVNVGALAVSSQVNGSFDFSIDGATCGQSANFDISVTADEMAGSNPDSFSHGPLEQDLVLTASRTDDFETDADGWSFPQGYARENVTADSGSWSIHSSDGQNDQNDVANSPIFRIGVGATQVVMATQHDIENPPWDRANVHAVRISDGSHTLLTPTGKTYIVDTWNAIGHVNTDNGWAGLSETWGDATFDLSGLVAGESYYLEVNHNTDSAVVGANPPNTAPFGHWFDNVRWSNVSFQVCDAQSDLCTPCTPPNAPTALTASATVSNRIDLSWTGVAPQPSNYRIFRATSSGGPYTQIASVSGAVTTYEDTAVTAGVTYFYVVRAFEICESADSNEDSATAFGDCTSDPTFSGATSVSTTSSGGSCGLRVEWSAGTNNCGGEPLVYNVYRSTTSGFTPGAGNLLQACVTTPFFDDTSAASGTTYFYVVRAEDANVGNGGLCQDGNEDTNSAEQSGSVGGSGMTTLYADDFDTGTPPYDGDWGVKTFTGDAAPVNWRGFQTCTANSGARIFRFGGTTCTGNYSATQFELAEPQSATGIAVPATATNVQMTFFHRRDFETNFDGGSLFISLDGGNYNFVPAAQLSGTSYNGTLGNFCPPSGGIAGLPIFTGTDTSFTQTTVALDPVCDSVTGGSGGCAGQNLWAGFMSISDCSFQQDGWFLDDVVITADLPAACSVAPEALSFLTATATGTAVNGENLVEWLNPSGGVYGSTMIRWSTADYPADPTDGTLLVSQNDGQGNHGTFTHSGLTHGTTYYYSAFVDNGSGEYSARKTVSARPFDATNGINWAYSTGASALAPPGIGSIYAVSNDRVLHSMDTAGGTGAWPTGWTPQAMNGPAQGRPPIVPVSVGAASKVAFLGAQDERVYAFDAESGSQLWASPQLGAMVQAGPAGVFTTYGGIADLILAGTRGSSVDNDLVALNLADGTIAWRFENTSAQGGDDTGMGIISGTAAVDYPGSRVYFTSRTRSGGSQNTVWCLSFNGSGATLLWARALGDIDAAPIALGSRVFVGTSSGQVHALDAITGADLWSSPFDGADGPIKGNVWPRFGATEILFSTTNRVYSIDYSGAAPSLNWMVATIPNPSPPLALPVSGTTYAWLGSSDGRLYQLDLTGALPVITSMVLGDGSATVGAAALDIFNEIAFVGTEEGRLYSVSLPLP